MTDELSPDLRQALRAEAYRAPVRLTASELVERIDVDRRTRRRQSGLLGAVAAAAVILIVVATSTTVLPRPLTNSSGASPSPSCAESPATKHGSWWYEMGGPRAFFNIEPGTRTAAATGSTWLLIVRFDPAPRSSGDLEIWASAEGSSDRVFGSLNSPMTPGSIARFDEPAPALPGGWFLFELPIQAGGCWTIDAAIDREVVGTATVRVAPGASDVPVASGGVPFNVIGTAKWCGSIGGCAYYLELEGEGRHDRVKLSAISDPDTNQETPLEDRRFRIELSSPVAPLDPGTYTATFTSFVVSDSIVNGEPPREQQLASCLTTFVVMDAAEAAGVVVQATFTATNCSASTAWVVLVSDPSTYDLDCGPIEATRCHELAKSAARDALLHHPAAHVESITFTVANGSYELVLDNGTVIALTVN